MICSKCSRVRYREFDTQGSGKTINNDGNISLFEVFKNNVVRLSISYRPCGVGTKFNTRDNEIKSYFWFPLAQNMGRMGAYLFWNWEGNEILLFDSRVS